MVEEQPAVSVTAKKLSSFSRENTNSINSETPCNIDSQWRLSAELSGHGYAGIRCYIACELTSRSHYQEFVVGDGSKCGEYLNMQLSKGRSYYFWLAFNTTVDGVRSYKIL